MKLTRLQWNKVAESLYYLGQKESNLWFTLYKMSKELDFVLKSTNELRLTLIDRLALRNEDGEYIFSEDKKFHLFGDKQQEFDKLYNELMDEEIDIPTFHPIQMDENLLSMKLNPISIAPLLEYNVIVN